MEIIAGSSPRRCSARRQPIRIISMQQRTEQRDAQSYSHKQQPMLSGASALSHNNNRSLTGVDRLFALPANRLHTMAPSTSASTRARNVAYPQQFNSPPQRSTKAKTLQEEFETLKRKIKEVQNKNQRILEKIHSTQQQERKRSLERRPPVFEVEVNLQHPVSENYAHGRVRSNIQVEEERDWQPSKLKMPSVKQYLRTSVGDLPVRSHSRSNVPEDSKRERQVTELKALVKELQAKNAELSSYLDKQRMERESCSAQLISVQDKLKKEHLRLETVKSSFRSYSDYARQLTQNSLDRFMDLLLNKLLQMDKKHKRNSQRLQALARQTRRQLDFRTPTPIQLPELSSVAIKEENLLEKSKSREFENIVAKYEQMIRSKNDEYEGMLARIRAKEREQQQAKQSLEKLKEEKRRLSLNSQQRIAELESSLTVLQNENRALRDELRNSRKQPSASEQSASRISIRSFSSQFRDQAELREEQLSELHLRINAYEKSIIDKNNIVIALERDLLNSKGKYTELFNEYQDSLQKIKNAAKQRTDELMTAMTQLKGQLQRKDQHLAELQLKQRQLEQRLVEMQVDYQSIKDRLQLKLKVPHARESPQQEDDLLQFRSQGHQKSEVQLLQTPNSSQQSATGRSMQMHKQLLGKVEQLTRENRNLQVQMIHEKAQAQMARTYKQELERLDIYSKQLELKVQQLNEQVEDLNRHLREPSELSISLGSTIRSIRRDSSRELPNTNAIELQLLEVEADNMRLSSQLINTKKDLELSERMKEQLNNRVRELKAYMEQLEKTNSELQSVVSTKLKEVESVRVSSEQRIRGLNDEKRQLEIQLQMQHELRHDDAKKKLDEQTRRNSSDSKMKDIEVERLSAKLKDLQEDLKQKDTLEKKLSEEYRSNLSLLKHELEQLKIANLRQGEVCKLQQHKIKQLELQVEYARSEISGMGDATVDRASNSSHIRSDADKIKQLEQSILQAKLEKATIQAHLRTSEENNSRLMQETSEMISELEGKKNELAKLAAIYEERLTEQQLIIKSYEKERRSSRQDIEHDARRKSDLKSHNSAFKEELEGEPLLQQPNIEQLFETNEYRTLRLRRKDLSKLLELTGDYIKRLKELLREKNKKIRVLERRIEELRNSPAKFHKTSSFNIHTQGEEVVESDEDKESIRDNYSVKMEDRKVIGNQRKLRQLQNKTDLVVQENHLLQQQVQDLQDELARAEQQENGLVRMKEIYKEQISNLRNLCQEKELQLGRLRKQLEGRSQQFQ